LITFIADVSQCALTASTNGANGPFIAGITSVVGAQVGVDVVHPSNSRIEQAISVVANC
jgi:hypothetical protein